MILRVVHYKRGAVFKPDESQCDQNWLCEASFTAIMDNKSYCGSQRWSIDGNLRSRQLYCCIVNQAKPHLGQQEVDQSQALDSPGTSSTSAFNPHLSFLASCGYLLHIWSYDRALSYKILSILSKHSTADCLGSIK
jgi:hypothetical protein